MDKVLECYERANELVKEGKNEEAIAEYKTGLAMLELSPDSPDRTARIQYFASKLAVTLYKLQRYNEARPYFDMYGQKMPKIPTNTQPFKKALKTLQKVGLLADLSTKELKRIIEDEMGMEMEEAEDELDLIEFLQAYYMPTEDPDEGWLCKRAIKDGFLHHDWRFGQETDDVVEEICQLIGSPIYRQMQYLYEPSEQHAGDDAFLVMESDKGQQVSIKVDQLDDIINFFNKELEARSDARRFVPIETNADWHGYYLLSADSYKTVFAGKTPALEICTDTAFDPKSWLKSKSK